MDTSPKPCFRDRGNTVKRLYKHMAIYPFMNEKKRFRNRAGNHRSGSGSLSRGSSSGSGSGSGDRLSGSGDRLSVCRREQQRSGQPSFLPIGCRRRSQYTRIEIVDRSAGGLQPRRRVSGCCSGGVSNAEQKPYTGSTQALTQTHIFRNSIHLKRIPLKKRERIHAKQKGHLQQFTQKNSIGFDERNVRRT